MRKQVNRDSDKASLEGQKPTSSAFAGPGESGPAAKEVGRGHRGLSFAGFRLQADGTLHSIFELQRSYNFMEGLHRAKARIR